MKSTTMIGWVEIIEDGKTIEAILDDDCNWSCETLPAVAERLNREFPEVVNASEERQGHDQLIGCAYRLGGIAWLAAGHAGGADDVS